MNNIEPGQAPANVSGIGGTKETEQREATPELEGAFQAAVQSEPKKTSKEFSSSSEGSLDSASALADEKDSTAIDGFGHASGAGVERFSEGSSKSAPIAQNSVPPQAQTEGSSKDGLRFGGEQSREGRISQLSRGVLPESAQNTVIKPAEANPQLATNVASQARFEADSFRAQFEARLSAADHSDATPTNDPLTPGENKSVGGATLSHNHGTDSPASMQSEKISDSNITDGEVPVSVVTSGQAGGLDSPGVSAVSSLAPVDVSVQEMVQIIQKELGHRDLHQLAKAGELSLTLDPELYPDTAIEVSLSEQGVEVTLVTENAEVQEFVTENLESLESMMDEGVEFKVRRRDEESGHPKDQSGDDLEEEVRDDD